MTTQPPVIDVRRVDWWKVITDLTSRGYRVVQIAAITGIPKSTLLTYRNLDAEPRHADGEALRVLWEQVMRPPLPTRDRKLRQRELLGRSGT